MMVEPRNPAQRTAHVRRTTRETDVSVRINLDGCGQHDNTTGIGFFDHMLDLLARHSGLDLAVSCKGDLHVDEHHSVEDVGITIGQAIRKALGDKSHIQRYGQAYVPMDEALARAVVDLSGRFVLHFDAVFDHERIGGLPTELIHHFWYSLAEKQAACTLHISVLYGTNTHHQVEAIFKAVARAFRAAVRRDPTGVRIPSTKGVL